MDDLTKIAIKHKTDKWGSHFYTPHYHAWFQHLRKLEVRVLEIGVGGYADPNSGGESLRMWKEYFPNGQIAAIDIYDKSNLEEERIKTYHGSQDDAFFLSEVNKTSGPFDIIIDDGSHINKHIIQSFKILFPLLKENGIYAVEDLQTSYWRKSGGDSYNLRRKTTAMNYFKHLLDSLNHCESENPFYRATYFDKNIVAVSFFHNMVFVQKGENNECSNIGRILRLPSKRPISKAAKYIRGRINSLLRIV